MNTTERVMLAGSPAQEAFGNTFAALVIATKQLNLAHITGMNVEAAEQYWKDCKEAHARATEVYKAEQEKE